MINLFSFGNYFNDKIQCPISSSDNIKLSYISSPRRLPFQAISNLLHHIPHARATKTLLHRKTLHVKKWFIYYRVQFTIMDEKENTEKKKMPIAVIIVIFILIFSVIATILLFGIRNDNSSDETPAASINDANATSSTSGKLVFGWFTVSPKYTDLKVLVYVNGTLGGYLDFPSQFHNMSGIMIWNDNINNSSAIYYDYFPQGGEINAGDYIEFGNLSPSTLYTFEFYHAPTCALLVIAGPHAEFGTPPNPPSASDVTFDDDVPYFDIPDNDGSLTLCDCLILLALGIALILTIFVVLRKS